MACNEAVKNQLGTFLPQTTLPTSRAIVESEFRKWNVVKICTVMVFAVLSWFCMPEAEKHQQLVGHAKERLTKCDVTGGSL